MQHFICANSNGLTSYIDDPTVNYSTIDFGGTMSSVVVDPTNAANMVVQTEKTAGAQTWAGTTLAIPGPGGPNVDTGFLNPIPFCSRKHDNDSKSMVNRPRLTSKVES